MPEIFKVGDVGLITQNNQCDYTLIRIESNFQDLYYVILLEQGFEFYKTISYPRCYVPKRRVKPTNPIFNLLYV